jgi:hypothetical protein
LARQSTLYVQFKVSLVNQKLKRLRPTEVAALSDEIRKPTVIIADDVGEIVSPDIYSVCYLRRDRTCVEFVDHDES